VSTAAAGRRRRVALPEAESIAALLGEVMDAAWGPPAAATRPPAPAAVARPADAPAGRFLAAVNWPNDPDRATAPPAPPAGTSRVGEPWETGGYLNQFAWD
jgi:hypothetical protein